MLTDVVCQTRVYVFGIHTSLVHVSQPELVAWLRRHVLAYPETAAYLERDDVVWQIVGEPTHQHTPDGENVTAYVVHALARAPERRG